MKKRDKEMKGSGVSLIFIALFIIVASILLRPLWAVMEEDGCYDAGGVWDNTSRTCSHDCMEPKRWDSKAARCLDPVPD